MNTSPIDSSLYNQLETISEKCINCNLCQKECHFLQKFGKPGAIAKTYDPSRTEHLGMPFMCSLCGLCAAVCPVDIDPSKMFLEMRKESVRREPDGFGIDCVQLGYETRGTSKHLSYYALPRHCDTIYFPGCSYPAGRPKEIIGLLNFLQRVIPNMGIVLDCCTKPSHDLGRTGNFEQMFFEMRDFLLANNIKTVLVNCPNCYKIFHTYGENLKVKTVYEVMADAGLKMTCSGKDPVAIHDPCVLRNENAIQKQVRHLLQESGVPFIEMKHNHRETLCCGEGGSVDCSAPELAKRWADIRLSETGGNPMITYCAGCVNKLGKLHPTTHILDLFFGPGGNPCHRAYMPGYPLTCINRIRLKNYLKRNVNSAVSRERKIRHESLTRLPLFNRNRLAHYVSKGLAVLFDH